MQDTRVLYGLNCYYPKRWWLPASGEFKGLKLGYGGGAFQDGEVPQDEVLSKAGLLVPK